MSTVQFINWKLYMVIGFWFCLFLRVPSQGNPGPFICQTAAVLLSFIPVAVVG